MAWPKETMPLPPGSRQPGRPYRVSGSTPLPWTVFASVRYDLEEMLRGVQAVVGEVPLVGASTAGEICNGPHHESVVVTIMASPYLEVTVGLGQRVSQNWQTALAQAVSAPGSAPFFSPDAT